MRFPSSLSKPSASPYSVPDRVSKMTREELRSGVEDRIQTVKFDSSFVPFRAESTLADLDEIEGQTVGEILNTIKIQAGERERISRNLHRSVSLTGLGVASLGVASLGVLTAVGAGTTGSFIPSFTLLGASLGILGSGLLLPDSDPDGYKAERLIQNVRGLAEFVACPEWQVESPQMTGPISKDDFIAEVTKHREHPHPFKYSVQRSADNALSIISQSDCVNSSELLLELEGKMAQVKTETKLSTLKSLAGTVAFLGGAFGALSGHVPGLLAAGLVVSGATLVASGVQDLDKLSATESKLNADRWHVAKWQSYLTGN